MADKNLLPLCQRVCIQFRNRTQLPKHLGFIRMPNKLILSFIRKGKNQDPKINFANTVHNLQRSMKAGGNVISFPLVLCPQKVGVRPGHKEPKFYFQTHWVKSTFSKTQGLCACFAFLSSIKSKDFDSEEILGKYKVNGVFFIWVLLGQSPTPSDFMNG